MGFDVETPLGVGGLGLDCWGLVVEGFLDLEGTFSDLPPLWLRHLSRGGRETIGGRAEGAGLVVGGFVVGGFPDATTLW